MAIKQTMEIVCDRCEVVVDHGHEVIFRRVLTPERTEEESYWPRTFPVTRPQPPRVYCDDCTQSIRDGIVAADELQAVPDG